MTQLSKTRRSLDFGWSRSLTEFFASQRGQCIALILIAAFSLILRLPEFGNPAPDFDEQIYYLIGERMWQGATPYVDIWDRKPIGLFLIYAASQLLGDQGVIQYQLLAGLFATATAWLIFLIARRTASVVGASCAALLYLAYLRVLLSAVGQSETFFMLFCVAAMYLAVRAIETENLGRIRNHAMAAMLMLGVGLQIKYTILFQCIFFGLFFLWRSFVIKRDWAAFAQNSVLFLAIGLAPTLLVTGYYAMNGQLDAFIYANFISIFDRGPLTGDIALYCIIYSAMALLPLAAIAMYQLISDRLPSPSQRLMTRLVIMWGLSGVGAAFFASSVYIYYFIPLVPALAILIGNFVSGQTQRWAILPPLLLYAGYISDYPGAFAKSAKDTAAISKITSLLTAHNLRDCIYVYDGPSILYSTTQSCIPTTHPYPDHLSNDQERSATGLDQSEEVRRIIATHPAAIITADRPVVPKLSAEPLAAIKRAVRDNYSIAGQAKYDRRIITVHIRKDLARPLAVSQAQ